MTELCPSYILQTELNHLAGFTTAKMVLYFEDFKHVSPYHQHLLAAPNLKICVLCTGIIPLIYDSLCESMTYNRVAYCDLFPLHSTFCRIFYSSVRSTN